MNMLMRNIIVVTVLGVGISSTAHPSSVPLLGNRVEHHHR